MIGKIMSEAAHSIIGMFSAKPLVMENNASNFDFGSLLNSPAEGAGSNLRGTEIDTSDGEYIDVDETDSAPFQHWETTNVLPFINQNLGGTIFQQGQTPGKLEQGQITIDPAGFDVPDAKLPPTFNRDGTINSAVLQNISPTEYSADGRPVSDKLPPENLGEVIDGKKLRNHQAEKAEEFHLRSQIRENAAAPEIFPSSDKGLLRLQSLQLQSRGAIDELTATAAKPTNAALVSKGGEQTEILAGLSQSTLRPSPRVAFPAATSSMQQAETTDVESAELVKSDLLAATKSLDLATDQQPIANASAQLAVRTAIQKPATFDMSAPQLPQRLAAEIADISVAGGTKTFEINPRNLGRMEITFVTRGSTEIIEIQTDHRAAKDIIVQHSQVLQEMLKSQGRDDLTFRVDVKENMFSSSKNDGGNLSQQENRDAREQQARPSQHRRMASSFDGATENDPASDNSRYA
jgi:hypothetical protein